MNTERTAEQKLRATSILCMACGGKVHIGPNYPEGVVLPPVLELWCPACHTINLHYRAGQVKTVVEVSSQP